MAAGTLLNARWNVSMPVACSERRTEPKDEAGAFGGARHFDADHGRGGGVKTDANPVTFLEPIRVDVAPSRRHLAGIDEERHVDELTRGPAVLAREKNSGVIAEA